MNHSVKKRRSPRRSINEPTVKTVIWEASVGVHSIQAVKAASHAPRPMKMRMMPGRANSERIRTKPTINQIM
jgi:hypothetical protein